MGSQARRKGHRSGKVEASTNLSRGQILGIVIVVLLVLIAVIGATRSLLLGTRPEPPVVSLEAQLATIEEPDLWVEVHNNSSGQVSGRAEAMSFDVDHLDLWVKVEGELFCVPRAIKPSLGIRSSNLDCGELVLDHMEVTEVSAYVSPSGQRDKDLVCGKNFASTRDQSIFACIWE